MEEINFLTLQLAKKYTDEHGGGGGGTSNYNDLSNQPQINGTTLTGNKSASDLGLVAAEEGKGLSENNYTDADKEIVGGVTGALAGKQDTLTFDDTPTDGSNNPVKSNGVYDALATKANTDMVAADFNAESSYTAGNYCIYEGKFYRFKNSHSGAWAAADVDEIKIAGELSSLKSGFTNLDNEVNGDAVEYPYADVITIPDAVPANLADCTVKIEPVQDLHGQSAPYVGGAGKNLFNPNFTSPTSNIDLIVNDDGSLTVNIKSATSTVFVVGDAVSLKANTSYTLSCDNASGSVNISVRNQHGGSVYAQVNTPNSSASINPTADTIAYLYLRLETSEATTVTLKPQLEANATATAWAPYENICPITGHTEASVQRDGVNLFDRYGDGYVENKYLNYKTGEYTNNNNWSVSGYINNCSGKNITISGMDSLGTQTYDICFYDKDKNFINGITTDQTTVSIPVDAVYIRFDYRKVDVETIQLELGSSATDYEPYQGKTYTIALGDTIYGGTVRIDSNGNTMMDVDRAVVDMGTLEWIKDSSVGHSRYVANNSGMKTNGSVISDIFQSAAYDQVYSHTKDNAISIHNTYSQFAVHSTYYENDYDATQFGNAMSGHYACYELATPFTVQLTPTQIQLLKGTNTLTASTGDISVTVNGVSGAIGAVQEQANDTDAALAELAADIAEQLPTAPTTDGAYVLTVTVADGTPTYSWESAT